jgi:hypothetical protein
LSYEQLRAEAPTGRGHQLFAPAIPGVGTSGGFTFVLEDRGGNDIPYLAANVDKFNGNAAPGYSSDQAMAHL